jgi:hypothetical protein
MESETARRSESRARHPLRGRTHSRNNDETRSRTRCCCSRVRAGQLTRQPLFPKPQPTRIEHRIRNPRPSRLANTKSCIELRLAIVCSWPGSAVLPTACSTAIAGVRNRRHSSRCGRKRVQRRTATGVPAHVLQRPDIRMLRCCATSRLTSSYRSGVALPGGAQTSCLNKREPSRATPLAQATGMGHDRSRPASP